MSDIQELLNKITIATKDYKQAIDVFNSAKTTMHATKLALDAAHINYDNHVQQLKSVAGKNPPVTAG